MEKVEFEYFDNNDDDVSNKVKIVASQIELFIKQTHKIICCDKQFNILQSNINNVLNYWVGKTYVGTKKNEKVIESFNMFFSELYDLLKMFKEKGNFKTKHLAKKSLYQGKIYRVLGYPSPNCNCSKNIELKCNSNWVSWSKIDVRNNNYFNSKLYGVKTYVETVISNDLYGIDLTAFNVSRKHESEIVFQTIPSIHYDIEYINPEEEQCE